MLDVRFFVPGTNVPKGNHAAFPIARARCDECKPGKKCARRNCFGGTIVGTVVTDDKDKELKAWEEFIRFHAISARNAQVSRIAPPHEPVEVRLVFLIARPDGHWTTKNQLSAEGTRRPMPSVKPDWDKLSRATADALKGALVEDDAQIVVANVAKVYASYGQRSGVVIRAKSIDRIPEWVVSELAAVDIKIADDVQGGLF